MTSTTKQFMLFSFRNLEEDELTVGIAVEHLPFKIPKFECMGEMVECGVVGKGDEWHVFRIIS